ncbi:putative Late nodulin [Medicago truncatula]|uniref:Nodule Cysteine-Rich (NCR) secreted peptide n=1 Tax=Medicago truncatula TaxID=3880 RepID=A0A072U9J8_MEDTR|nr:Nodule Cysteine-Rich (NCR) secreted peptide [Medicago truncatula]RHN51501.1 putative Late nodulin [Medicago truncatula]
MAKIINFVYNMIIFFSLFLVATNAGGCNPCLVTCPDDLLNRCPPGMEPICEYGVIKCYPIGKETNRVLT